MDRGIYSSPRVLVRVRGGAKRLAVDILLFGFQDEVSRDGKPLFDSYCEHLTEYLQYLRDCDYKADDIPNRTMVRIFWHWMDCESFRMQQDDHGVKLNLKTPYVPEPEFSSAIWKDLMRDDIARVVDDFNVVQAPMFYDGAINILNQIKWPEGWGK